MSNQTHDYGITGFGGYIPRLRMQRAAIVATHQWMAPGLRSLGKGQRAFCSWDEDTITMAVEAARDALGQRTTAELQSLTLASTRMPYANMQNSSLVAASLQLPATAATADQGYSERAGVAGLLAALRSAAGPALVVASDHPPAKPASTQELTYGAGAAAFTLGSDKVLARLVGHASRNNTFVDHYRAEDQSFDYFWEERWIREEGYLKVVPQTVKAALQQAGLTAADVHHFVLASSLKAVDQAVAKKLGIAPEAVADALDSTCGYAGAAHAPMMLALALERAQPGQHIVVVGFSQGCDVLVLQVTDALADFKPVRGISGALADAQPHDAYMRMLSYAGGIDLEWGMRAEKVIKTALTDQYRSSHQLAGFVAGHCRACGTVQFPQLTYCVNPACNAPAAQFDPVSLRDVPAQVLTYTADALSYHPAPPLYVGFVQFNNGARLLMEVVDVGAAGLEVGTPLRSVLRIKDLDKARGHTRYFWKMTPLAA